MADDIKVLGESLLADQRKRNDRIYKETRREAYKLGLMQAGVSILNSGLQQKTRDFLASEPAMTARVKQRRGYEDAQFYIRQQDNIDNSGQSALDYFTKQVQPLAEEIALEQFKEQNFDKDSYMRVIREYSQELAAKRLEAHQRGFEVASTISSPEDFAAFQAIQATKNSTGFDWAVSSLKAMFGGKSREDLDQEVIESIANSPQVQNAETVSALRKAYSQIGDINIAQRVAGAIESGRIEEAERIVRFKVGPSFEESGPWGEKTTSLAIIGEYEDGSLAFDKSGSPYITTQRLSTDGRDLTRYRPDTAKVMNSLTDGEKALAQDSLVAFEQTLGEEDKETWNMLLKQFSSVTNADGTQAIDISIAARNVAAQGKVIAVQAGMDSSDAYRLASQVALDRARRATVPVETGWFDLSFDHEELDFTKLNLTAEPDSVELLHAFGSLEGTANAINFTGDQLSLLLGNLEGDFSSYDSNSREAILRHFSENQDKYSFLFQELPDGTKAIDILLDADGLAYAREERFRQEAPPRDVQEVEQLLNDPMEISGESYLSSGLIDIYNNWRNPESIDRRNVGEGNLPQLTYLDGDREEDELSRSLREKVPVAELRNKEQFQSDADKYLTYLYGPGYKEDIVETIYDEINDPIIAHVRAQDLPEDLREVHQRLTSELEGAPSGNWREAIKFLKNQGIDAVSSPSIFLTALAFIGGRSPVARSVTEVGGGRFAPPEGVALPAPGATPKPTSQTFGSVTGSIRARQTAELQRSTVQQRRWEARMDQHRAETEFRSYPDPAKFMTKDDLVALGNRTAPNDRFMSTDALRDMARRADRLVNRPSVGRQAKTTRESQEAEARQYFREVFGRDATNKDITKYIKDVYGGTNVGQFNIR